MCLIKTGIKRGSPGAGALVPAVPAPTEPEGQRRGSQRWAPVPSLCLNSWLAPDSDRFSKLRVGGGEGERKESGADSGEEMAFIHTSKLLLSVCPLPPSAPRPLRRPGSAAWRKVLGTSLGAGARVGFPGGRRAEGCPEEGAEN